MTSARTYGIGWALAGVVILAIIAGGIYFLTGVASSATNEQCVVYSGGPFEEKDFKQILPEGQTRARIGFGSDAYCYRTDQRTYISGRINSGAEDRDSQPDAATPEIVGKGTGETDASVRLLADYQLYLKLNTDPEVLRQFHENLGVKTEAWTEDGWRQMLREYLEPQIERSMEAAALRFEWDNLYANEETRRQFQAETVKLLKTAITDVIGGDYFCGPGYVGGSSDCGDFTFTVGKPRLASEELVAAIESEETAKRETAAQVERNRRITTQLDAERERVALYGPEGALIRQAIEAGKVQFYVIPEGGTPPAIVPPGG